MNDIKYKLSNIGLKLGNKRKYNEAVKLLFLLLINALSLSAAIILDENNKNIWCCKGEFESYSKQYEKELYR